MYIKLEESKNGMQLLTIVGGFRKTINKYAFQKFDETLPAIAYHKWHDKKFLGKYKKYKRR